MTREEAMSVIINSDRIWMNHTPKEKMALNMAVVALEDWEPVVRCKDCDRGQVDFDERGEVTFRCRMYDPWIVYVNSDGMGYCSNGRRR